MACDLQANRFYSQPWPGEPEKMDAWIKKLKGANMDIDMASPQGSIAWEQDQCPWNLSDRTIVHKCAVKNVSICKFFRGVEYLDTLLCCYPNENVRK
jgi:hypothetical protein